MARFRLEDFDVQTLLFLASTLNQNPVVSVFLLLTLVFRILVWPLLAPLMPTARLVELESVLKTIYPLFEMQSPLSNNSRIHINEFELEVLALLRVRLNVQRRLILGGYSWKEYFLDMWNIWRGAQACRKRIDAFRIELEIGIVEDWEVRHEDILRHYGMNEVTRSTTVPLQFRDPYRAV
ncbi:uncharacterized protein EV420DRAFT_1019246 [Desarmillaria tabescens]|uniref:Uncharacterized protein n=1 Tax=Armillaria tabescens TaxID=1929756 RepID=A0AA39JKP2_ARMTA|nr:uncharacterized protein EV420DRAFT_1019246 [Desarmillaria tabescens]KAK0443997.1 hypothetical protein EV420DRAFT_1019246 [Desarmillaria tabescens]